MNKRKIFSIGFLWVLTIHSGSFCMDQKDADSDGPFSSSFDSYDGRVVNQRTPKNRSANGGNKKNYYAEVGVSAVQSGWPEHVAEQQTIFQKNHMLFLAAERDRYRMSYEGLEGYCRDLMEMNEKLYFANNNLACFVRMLCEIVKGYDPDSNFEEFLIYKTPGGEEISIYEYTNENGGLNWKVEGAQGQ